jgi:predicted RNA-binding Zn-ribbon protein involved in translation (DUF1610 family)
MGTKRKIMFALSDVEEYIIEDCCAGGCIACGAIVESDIEPDARGYKCPECGAMAVYGLEELLIMGRVR